MVTSQAPDCEFEISRVDNEHAHINILITHFLYSCKLALNHAWIWQVVHCIYNDKHKRFCGRMRRVALYVCMDLVQNFLPSSLSTNPFNFDKYSRSYSQTSSVVSLILT